MIIFSILFSSLHSLFQAGFYRFFISKGELSRKQMSLAFLWGAIGAVILSTLTFLSIDPFVQSTYNDAVVRDFAHGGVFGPMYEEVFKSLPIILLVLASRLTGRRKILVLCGLSGVGFFFTESILYMLDTSTQQAWEHQVTKRVFTFGFKHGFYASLFGLGLGYASRSSHIFKKLAWSTFGFALAYGTHMTFNMLAIGIDQGHATEGWNYVYELHEMLFGFFLMLMLFARYRISNASQLKSFPIQKSELSYS